MSARAYQQWLRNKQLEEQQRKKEKILEREIRNICEEEKKAHQERAKADFLSWKKRKDFERALSEGINHPKTEAESLNPVVSTPVLPGYCSVWACDEDLAEQMLTRVHRPS